MSLLYLSAAHSLLPHVPKTPRSLATSEPKQLSFVDEEPAGFKLTGRTGSLM